MNDGVLGDIERRLDDLVREVQRLNDILEDKQEPEIKAGEIVEVLNAIDEVEIKSE